MENTATKHSELDAFISALPISYSADFIPQSKSRNAGDKNPSINWKVTLTRNPAATLTTDYMQGIGHIPNYQKIVPFNSRRTVAVASFEKLASEQGKAGYSLDGSGMLAKPLPKPELRDVLYSLIMDSDVLNYSSFEDWAQNFGYETDSRKAEKIYNACLAIALQLRGALGQPAIDKLQVLFQDY